MMSPVSLSSLVGPLGAQLLGQDRVCHQVVSDSRNMPERSLFVAISGERFDGHDFVAGLDPERHAALVSRPIDCSVSQLQVEDTLLAFGQIASLQRQQFDKPLIGLTGSCGKTSTKEMIAAVLATAGNVYATRGNLNNEIGVPTCLLEMSPENDFAVIEMGAAEKGDIAYLCQFSRPDIALVTNAHEAHIGRFGSLQNIIETKGEIYQAMNNEGTALVNLDDHAADYWQSHCQASNCFTYALENMAADYRAVDVQLLARESCFNAITPNGDFPVMLNVPGRHSVYNALVAIAVADLLEVPVEKVQQALAAFQSVAGRGQFLPGLSGSTVIDESYNANPGSVKSSVDLLMAQGAGKKILVLADMAELGEDSLALHAQVGDYAKKAGIDQLLVFGPDSVETAKAFGSSAKRFDDKALLITELEQLLDNDAVVLVKGSRSMAMEEVVEALTSIERGEA